MVVTHLFQVLAFMAMEPPTALEPGPIGEEKNKVFRSLQPIDPALVVRGQYDGYLDEPGVHAALGDRDVRRAHAARSTTGAGPACRSTSAPASASPTTAGSSRSRSGRRPRACSRADRASARTVPTTSPSTSPTRRRLSLSFYGKRPGPGMRLDKQSLEFALARDSHAGELLEAYERLIYDAMCSDRTLFNTADGIESVWEKSAPLLAAPPPVRPVPGRDRGGPNAIRDLIAPDAWRLPFERPWRSGDRELSLADATALRAT